MRELEDVRVNIFDNRLKKITAHIKTLMKNKRFWRGVLQKARSAYWKARIVVDNSSSAMALIKWAASFDSISISRHSLGGF